MELAIDDPIRRAKEYAINPNNYQTPQAPLSSNPGVGTQMADMAKQKLMQEAVTKGTGALTGAGSSALAGSGMGAAAMTAMPYLGAGLLAGKAFGLFNEGGMVGPMSPQYNSKGSRVLEIPNAFPTDEQVYDEFRMYKNVHPDGELSLSDIREILQTAYPPYRINYNTGGQVGPLNMKYAAKGSKPDYLDLDKDGNKKEPMKEAAKSMQYKAQGGMTESQARALMMNQPDPDELYNEIIAESMTEAAQQTTPTPMPKMRPPLGIDPYGADMTSSPYDMIRSDNAPNT